MSAHYPSDLQERFEEAIVGGSVALEEIVSVSDLTARFGASVEQMAQVLETAKRKGLVDATDGGFRILGLPETDRSSVFTHTAESGLKPRSLVRGVTVEPASAEVAAKLDVPEGSPVFCYVRTRYVEEQALANQTNFMPYAVCPQLEEDDVSHTSFQKLLEKKYHAVTPVMDERFELLPATEEDQEILGVPVGSSILLVERIARGATGWPLVWAQIHIRPDRYDYVAALWPEAANLLKT